MRRFLPLLSVLCGCAESTVFATDGGFDTGAPQAADLCVVATPKVVQLQAQGPDTSVFADVVLSWRGSNCEVAETMIDTLTLDDPFGVFDLSDLGANSVVDRANEVFVTVELNASAAGHYEGQLLVEGHNNFGEGGLTVELSGDVPPAE